MKIRTILLYLLVGIVLIELAALYYIVFGIGETGRDILPNPKNTSVSQKDRTITQKNSQHTVNACEECVYRVGAFYGNEIKRVALERQMDWRLLTAIVATEVGGLTAHGEMANAVGKSGEIGLMQIKESAAQEFGVPAIDLYHPMNNLRTGSALFQKLKSEMSSDKCALIAYNEGRTGAKRIIGNEPCPGDHPYVKKVSANAAVLGFRVK